MKTFNVGAPPYAGWWLTQVKAQSGEGWRWWNGKFWSYIVYDSSEMETVSHKCLMPTLWPANSIVWSDYWPENARVPRFDPAEGWVWNLDGRMPQDVDQIWCLERCGVRTLEFADWMDWALTDQPTDIVAWKKV